MAAEEMQQSGMIKVYDMNLQRQGVIDVYRSFIWTRKYMEAGTVEVHAALNSKNLKLLKTGNIITMTGAVESAIIEGIAADDVTCEITATGRMLSSLLERRGIKTVVNITNQTYEDAMRKLVDVSAISTECPLPHLELGNLMGVGENVTLQASHKDLYSYLTSLAACGNLGFRIHADYRAKAMYFEVYEGKDHSKSQKQNKRVIFSEVYRNIGQATYTVNEQKYKTHAVVLGEGEGDARTVVEAAIIPEAKGWERRELIVDARDMKKGSMTDEQYRMALVQRGIEKLAAYGTVECLEAVVLPNTNFTYKQDYDIGDIVTVDKKAWGIMMDKRITEIQEIYENGAFSIVPTFGEPLPDQINLTNT